MTIIKLLRRISDSMYEYRTEKLGGRKGAVAVLLCQWTIDGLLAEKLALQAFKDSTGPTMLRLISVDTKDDTLVAIKGESGTTAKSGKYKDMHVLDFPLDVEQSKSSKAFDTFWAALTASRPPGQQKATGGPAGPPEQDSDPYDSISDENLKNKLARIRLKQQNRTLDDKLKGE